MTKPPLTDEALKATWSAYEAAGYNQEAAARALGMARSTIQNRIAVAKKRLGVTEPQVSELTADEAAKLVKSAVADRTLEQDVTLHRAKENEKAARAKLKEATAEINKLREKIAELEWASNVSFTPAEWSTPRRSAKPTEHMPYLFLSDEQAGEVVDADATEHAVGYNQEIFRKRHRHVVDTAIYLAQEHSGSSWKFPGLILSLGGDAISGGIHDELVETDDLTPLEAVELVFEERAGAIKKLADAFGKVDVKDCGGGNHGRDTRKPQSKNRSGHNFEPAILRMLSREFKNDKRVTFQTTKSPDVYFPIYERRILMTHGDNIGSRGGQGMVGPAATIMRGAQKVIMEQAALGRVVDEVHMGHFHQFMYMGWVLVNGCFPGYSEFAKNNRMRPGPPEQTLLFYHPKRGVVDLKRIYLGDVG